MRSKIFILSIVLCGLTGCMIWDAGYTTNLPVTTNTIDSFYQTPITYTVTCKYRRNDIFAFPTEKSLRDKIEKALKRTGLFSSVRYGQESDKAAYHIEFTFYQGGTRISQSARIGMFAGYTLCLIPCGETFTFDGAAKLYLQGGAIFSTAKAEQERCMIWLPLAPIGLFMNSWTACSAMENGTVNALVEEVANEHKRRFLKK